MQWRALTQRPYIKGLVFPRSHEENQAFIRTIRAYSKRVIFGLDTARKHEIESY